MYHHKKQPILRAGTASYHLNWILYIYILDNFPFLFPLKIDDRYQIFLGGYLTDKFLNIGDDNGTAGADHCELVGGQEMDAVLPGTYGNAPALTGKLCLSQTEGIAVLYYIFTVGY